jgi:PAS domain S-box-containing protein
MVIRDIRPDGHLAILHQSLIGEAVDHSPMLVFVADEAMRYVAVSSRACEVLGYTRDELLALSVLEVAFEPTAQAEYEEMIATGYRAGTAKLLAKDGQAVKFMYFATEARIAGLPFYVSCGVLAA